MTNSRVASFEGALVTLIKSSMIMHLFTFTDLIFNDNSKQDKSNITNSEIVRFFKSKRVFFKTKRIEHIKVNEKIIDTKMSNSLNENLLSRT